MGDIPELEGRPLRAADKPAVLDLVNAAEHQSPLPILTSTEDMDDEWAEPGCEPASDTWSLWDGERLVAWIKTAMRPDPTKYRAVWMTGRVHPEWRRRGLGTRLVRWAVQRAEARLAAEPDDLTKRIRSTVYEEESGTVALYEACGFTPERYFVELTKKLDGPQITTSVPPGLEIEPWTRELDDSIRKTHNEAFKDHWGSEPLTEERWRRWISDNRAFLPDSSFVAVASREVVGYAVNFAFPEEWETQGFSEGWIGGLGTARSWRRKGVASALIEASNEAFKELGYQQSTLGVDADNPTGAVGLYTRLGFEPFRREISYAIALTESD